MKQPSHVLILIAGVAWLAACHRTPPDNSESGVTPSAGDVSRIPLGNPPGQAKTAAQSIPNPFEGDADAIAHGKALYGSMNCVYCHGAGGAGLMGPALNGHGWRYGGTPGEVFNSIHDGRPKGMPAWGDRLPSQEIWRLTAYIESLGGTLPPATAAMTALGAPEPSGTGPQAAEQATADTAAASLARDNKAEPR
jgi:cytochrome c oxidase cbb3-type subunit 3